MYKLGVMFRNAVSVLRKRLHMGSANTNTDSALARADASTDADTVADVDVGQTYRRANVICTYIGTTMVCNEV